MFFEMWITFLRIQKQHNHLHLSHPVEESQDSMAPRRPGLERLGSERWAQLLTPCSLCLPWVCQRDGHWLMVTYVCSICPWICLTSPFAGGRMWRERKVLWNTWGIKAAVLDKGLLIDQVFPNLNKRSPCALAFTAAWIYHFLFIPLPAHRHLDFYISAASFSDRAHSFFCRSLLGYIFENFSNEYTLE